VSVKASVLRSSLWIMIGNTGQHIVSFALFIYLAHILTPADFGLVALALGIVEITAYVSRMGQVEVLQQRDTLDDISTSTALWLLVLFGTLASGGVALFALVSAEVASAPLFSEVLLLLAPVCFLNAISAVPEAVFKRRLKLRAFAVRNIVATLLGAGVALWLVWEGFGVYALVGQHLSTAALQALAVWLQLAWLPQAKFRRSEAIGFARAGAAIMVAGSVNQFNARVADILTGTFLGTEQLGYLRITWRFFNTIAQLIILPISGVALTAFRRVRDSYNGIGRAYMRVTQIVALAAFPIFFGLSAVADPLVPLTLGEQWMPAIPLIQLLPFMVVAGSINYFFGSVLIAVGRNRQLLQQSMIQLTATIIFLSIGLFWGLIGVMIAHITRALAISAYNLVVLRQTIYLDVGAALKRIMPPFVSCVAMYIVVSLLKAELMPSLDPLALLAVLIPFGAAFYLLCLWLGDVLGLWNRHFYDSASFLADALRRRKETAG